MPPPLNHHVRTEMAAMHARMVEGVNAGVELPTNDVPAWIARVYMEHGPYQRGLLLGVLLDELERNGHGND